SQEMVEALEALCVRYVLKVPDWPWVRARLGRFRRSAKHTSSRETLWTTSTRLYGARLFSLERRRPLRPDSGDLALETCEVTKRAHVLTNIAAIHALTAWRLYTRGAVVEHRIAETRPARHRQDRRRRPGRQSPAVGHGCARLPAPARHPHHRSH